MSGRSCWARTCATSGPRPARGSSGLRAARSPSTATHSSCGWLLQQPGQAAVLEQATARLTFRAVVDRVLLEIDARDRRRAHVALLAETVVDPVRPLVGRSALTQLEPALELGLDRGRETFDLVGLQLRRQ